MNKCTHSFYFLALFLSVALPAHSQEIVQTYYVSIPENEILTSYQTIRPSATCGGGNFAVDPITTYVSFVISRDNGKIYFDHWEDGYEVDLENPVQSTTEIWGDGDTSNGSAPGFSSDVFSRGSVVVLNNNVVTSTRETVIDFDGGDKIGASVPITLTRAGWAGGTGTVMGDATEQRSTLSWGTKYTVPTGEATSAGFDYTGLSIMAAENNTVVSVDRNADGLVDLTTQIEEGKTVFIDGGIAQGATISSTKAVQAFLITGQRCSQYQSRWFLLTPDSQLADDYYSPVGYGGSDTAAVWLHNPNSSPITIKFETSAGAQPDISVPAKSTVAQDVTSITGSRFYTTDNSKFVALGVLDKDAVTYDWGYTVPSARQLRQQAQVGLGIGRDPTSSSKPNENGSPVWLSVSFPAGSTSSGSIDVCVDYDGDRLGPLTDSNGIKYDQKVTQNPLQTTRVYDTDGDQTGMMLWVCDGSDGLLNAVWGQDPDTASAGAPAIDAGTTVPAFPAAVAAKSVALSGDTNGNGWLDLNEQVTYTITISQSGNLPVPSGSLTIKDTLPSEVAYVAGSSQYVIGSAVNSIADSSTGTPFPFDDSGVSLPVTIPIDGSVQFKFIVTVTSVPSGSNPIKNVATIDGEEIVAVNNLYIPASLSGTIFLDDSDQSGSAGNGEGISGVTLTLRDSSNNIVATTTTGSDGSYLFSNLRPDTYRVVVDSSNSTSTNPLVDKLLTVDPDGGVAGEVTYTLVQDQEQANIDIGYESLGSINGTVFNDLNNSGSDSSGEGLSGVQMTLLDSNGGTVSTTTTNANGDYSFPNLRQGNYTVQVDSLNHNTSGPLFNFSQTEDPDTAFDAKTALSLAAGQNVSDRDFGYQASSALGTISGSVFVDTDSDAAYDSGEETAQVTVDLVRGGVTYQSVLTTSTGEYTFTNVPPGEYTVMVSSTSAANSALLKSYPVVKDPDATLDGSNTVTLPSGGAISGLQFGFALDSDGDGQGDSIDTDDDNDGIPDSIEGNLDSDGDGIPDSLDTDSDNDGISDQNESSSDTDGDGSPDYRDLDSDNDGISDTEEGRVDTDGDGVPNFQDLDSDGDGILDETEGTEDRDSDGLPNYLDKDSDDDGIRDLIECQPLTDFLFPTNIDTDGDGIDDAFDPDNGGMEIEPIDTDGDGDPDFLDTDADGDSLSDNEEGFDFDDDGQIDIPQVGADLNGDGLDDAYAGIDEPGEVNDDWREFDTGLCEVSSIRPAKSRIRWAGRVLVKRAKKFRRRAQSCGCRVSGKLVDRAETNLEQLLSTLTRTFGGTDQVYDCREQVACTVERTSRDRRVMRRLSGRIYRSSLRMKTLAIECCQTPKSDSDDRRQTTKGYHKMMVDAVRQMPRLLSQCPGVDE